MLGIRPETGMGTGDTWSRRMKRGGRRVELGDIVSWKMEDGTYVEGLVVEKFSSVTGDPALKIRTKKGNVRILEQNVQKKRIP